MKVGSLKEYREARPDLNQIHDYLRTDQTKLLRELFLALQRLSFTDNFESFKTTVTIPATSEVAIRNELRSRSIPTEWIRVRGGDGSQNVVDGDTPWTRDHVYLKNTGASDAVLTIVFLKS